MPDVSHNMTTYSILSSNMAQAEVSFCRQNGTSCSWGRILISRVLSMLEWTIKSLYVDDALSYTPQPTLDISLSKLASGNWNTLESQSPANVKICTLQIINLLIWSNCQNDIECWEHLPLSLCGRANTVKLNAQILMHLPVSLFFFFTKSFFSKLNNYGFFFKKNYMAQETTLNREKYTAGTLYGER